MLWAESSIKTIGNREEIWSQSFQTLALRFVRANLLSIQKLLDFAAQMWVLINKGDIYVTPFAILLKRYNASLKLNSKILSRGVLLYISHRGMCPPPPQIYLSTDLQMQRFFALKIYRSTDRNPDVSYPWTFRTQTIRTQSWDDSYPTLRWFVPKA